MFTKFFNINIQSEAGIKLLKANENRYHLNIKAITSGGINTDDYGNSYASLYVRYQNIGRINI
ncbi:MAG: hypothetical protein AJITA_00603 [Acetilactobacillus jinshanensis]